MCLPVGNRNSYLNLNWDVAKPVSDNQIKQRESFIIKTFEAGYLPDSLLKLYHEQNRFQNKVESDVEIFRKIRYELGLPLKSTFPEKLKVFKPIN